MQKLTLPPKAPVSVRGTAWAVKVARQNAFVIRNDPLDKRYFGQLNGSTGRARAFATPRIIDIIVEGTASSEFKPDTRKTVVDLGDAKGIVLPVLWSLSYRGINFSRPPMILQPIPDEVRTAVKLGDHTLYMQLKYIVPPEKLDSSDPLTPHGFDALEIERRLTWSQTSTSLGHLLDQVGVSQRVRRLVQEQFAAHMDEAVIDMGFRVGTTDITSGTVEFLAYGNVPFRLTPASLERIEQEGRGQ